MALLPERPDDSAVEVRATEESSRFEGLVREYGQLLRNAIARLCPPNLGLHTADIEQEATIRLWQCLRGEKEIDHPASYFYRVAATATIDAVRRVKRRREDQLRLEGDDDGAPTPLPPDTERSPETLFRRREIADKIRTALSRLPENRRRAVALHLKGMTTHEIGRMAGWTEAKARNLVYRGLADLRDELRRMGIDVETV
jgi:RNA polymerase sigma factor (sigma-70 family)